MPLPRRDFVGLSAVAGLSLLKPQGAGKPTASADDVASADIRALGEAMRKGATTSHAITQKYLSRIAAMDKAGPAINAVIEIDPDALAIADQRDAERKAGRLRGPLHGIPVLIKDNIDSADKMKTTAGSLALATNTAPRDAFIVAKLRDAGAVLLGKTNLSEWANYRSTHSSSGWSGRGGQTKNPYVLDRNPCGSSSGTGAAISAGFAAVGIGTETDGSIICPSGINGLVGVKPTVGLWSRSGIIPISASQDTAGPMARSVTDAAILLGALTGVDQRDGATGASAGRTSADYTTFLTTDSLKGARIGVARNLAGFHDGVDRLLDNAVAALTSAGAIVVDPANLETANKYGDAETTVLDYEFKAGIAAYFAALGPKAPFRSLADLIAWNTKERAREMPFFGQEIFERAVKCGPLTDTKYREARAKCLKMTRDDGIDALMTRHRLDVIISPSNQPAWVTDHVNGDHFTGGDTSFAAVAGYPSVTVPMGFVSELPIGLSFTGRAWSEGRLLQLAFGFESVTNSRRAPRFLPTL